MTGSPRLEVLEADVTALDVDLGEAVGDDGWRHAVALGDPRRHLAAGSGLERVVFCVRGADARAAFERALVAY